jgi:hypothetical protein
MSWFKRNQAPRVKIQDNRFSIEPVTAEIIDVEAQSTNLPALRQSSPSAGQPVAAPSEAPAPRQGVIPAHSWGA